MSHLKDTYLSDVRSGSLIFPSSGARRSGNGGYVLDGENRCVKRDADLFPAIVINPRQGLIATPSGMKFLSKHSLIAVVT